MRSRLSRSIDLEFSEPLNRSLQRSSVAWQFGPEIADLRNTLGHGAQRKTLRVHVSAFDLFPRARRGNRRASFRSRRISRSEGGAVTVATGIDVNPAFAIDFAELLRQPIRSEPDEQRADCIGEARDR